ncbi:MAG TPA: hypothetical protein VM686_00330, partial [Polyangiaceae bacterium]|nr:hypothetical protein [Polyangiaceae bacterium]
MSQQTLWYMEEDPVEAAAAMVSVARAEWAAQGQQRMRIAEDCLALYMGSARHSLTGATNPMAVLGLVDESSSYNVVQAIVDTKVNHTLRNQIRPMFVTEGGDSELREKAEAMQEAADGIAYDLELDGDLGRQACFNGFCFEGGGVEWWADYANKRVDATPVWPWQYFVPRQEARYGRPRQQFARYVIPRDVLLSFVGDNKAAQDAVKSASSAPYEDVRNAGADEPGKVVDMVVVWKAWHLPSTRVDLNDPRAYGESEKGNKAKANHDGRHIVALDSKTADTPPIVDIPWPHEYYPVSWFKPNPVPGSFWSRGEPEVLANAQIELNRWNARMEKILDLHARPLILLSKGAKLNPGMLNNALGNILQVEGNTQGAITHVTPSATPADLLRRVENIPQWARDQRGMSEMSMTARKPAGINHEPGLAYLADTETQRHTVEFKAWQRFNVDSYKNIIRCLNELARRVPGYEVVFTTAETLKRHKWDEIHIDEDMYRLKAWGANFFKQSPAQRADQIMDLIDRGMLPPEDAFDAIDAPDLKALMGDRNIMLKNATRRLDLVAKGPEYTFELMPDPYDPLEMFKREGLKRKARLEYNGEAADKIERVVKFLQDVDALMP